MAGGSWSFDQASEHLHSFCGIEISDELIRQVSLKEGAKIAAWQATTPAAVADFIPAAGDPEFETDAVKVNTTEGWRDAKIGIFARRPRGQSVATDQWDKRRLPKHTARHAFAAIADSESFAIDWGTTALRLGIDPDSHDLTVLGDGADWIWNRAKEQFPNAQGVLDVFHAVEHISDTAKVLFGDGTDATKTQSDRGTQLLLSDGYAGLTAWLGEIANQPRVGTDGAALGTMLNYFANHQTRLNYALRLHRGQAIGSGMVEGAAKNMIGRRLKANNARWREPNVTRIAGLCTAMYSGTWKNYWQNN
jgi:hypothetical protein